MYCDAKNSSKRQSTILLLKIILNALLKWFAPILSFIPEEIFKLISDKKSIHLEKFIDFPIKFKNDNLNLKWIKLIKIRNICNLSIEEKRSEKIIGSSLEALLKIELNQENFEIVKNIDLSELCITSSVKVEKTEQNEILVKTEKAQGDKCPVCWKISLQPCERHGA